MRALVIAALLLLGCQREPSIVVRFDVSDAAVAHATYAHATDAARPVDAARPTDAAAKAQRSAEAKAGPVCKTDGDCTLVPDGCCDCANGGRLVATSKVLAQREKKDCKDAVCTMMISTDPTCGRRPACIAGVCGMREALPSERRPPRLKLPAAK